MTNQDQLIITKALKAIAILLFFAGVIVMAFMLDFLGFWVESKQEMVISQDSLKTNLKFEKPVWKLISMDAVVHEKDPELVKYGRELIANTALYLGPKGKVAPLTNGMNCQNCHLEAGSKVWGNNYGAVASTYPKFRERSGTKESIIKRINDCMERSLNGKSLDSTSREMQAMVAYIKFLGQFVPKDSIPNGSGIWKLKYMDRAASPENGKLAYEEKCASCHGLNGEGVKNADGIVYTYPPLWGSHSYNNGAGLYRLSRFAGYIKTNMPFGVTYDKPQLSDEEAWDIAAYVNSQPRPSKDLSKDWPKLSGKPFDHPFGPYADPFSENQHKYGPFKPIDSFKKKAKKLQESANKASKI